MVGCALVAVFVGAPPLPVVVGVADFVALGEAEVRIPVLGTAVSETEHGLALGEAVTGVLSSCFVTIPASSAAAEPSSAVGVVSSADEVASPGSAELESVAEADADALASVSEGDAEAEAEAEADSESEAPAVGVLEQAGEAVSASAEAGSTSEVP